MIRNTVLLTLIILLVVGCLPEESPLSDIELTDPSLISPSIKLMKSINKENVTTNNIEIWLYDKNKNSVELKGGEVRVNGLVLSIKRFNITHAPYYSIQNIIELKTDYQFEIEFSDGNIYTASVQTPDKDLKILNLPSNYTSNDDMDISWKDAYLYEEMDIGLNRYFSTDTSGGQSLGKIEIQREYFLKGSYSIPKKHFNIEFGKIYKAIITVSGIRKGFIDERFNSDREIESVFSISKEIPIN